MNDSWREAHLSGALGSIVLFLEDGESPAIRSLFRADPSALLEVDFDPFNSSSWQQQPSQPQGHTNVNSNSIKDSSNPFDLF